MDIKLQVPVQIHVVGRLTVEETTTTNSWTMNLIMVGITVSISEDLVQVLPTLEMNLMAIFLPIPTAENACIDFLGGFFLRVLFQSVEIKRRDFHM